MLPRRTVDLSTPLDPPVAVNRKSVEVRQKIYPAARILPAGDIPWQAVRENGGGGDQVMSDDDDEDSGDLHTSEEEEEHEASPDEGIRSWNASSVIKTSVADLPAGMCGKTSRN